MFDGPSRNGSVCIVFKALQTDRRMDAQTDIHAIP